MRNIACVALIFAVLCVSAANLAAQSNASRNARRVIDPMELAGPPKKPPVITPAMRALMDSSVVKANTQDAKEVAGALRELTSLIQRFPNEPDLYFTRATLACQNNGNRESIASVQGLTHHLKEHLLLSPA